MKEFHTPLVNCPLFPVFMTWSLIGGIFFGSLGVTLAVDKLSKKKSRHAIKFLKRYYK